MMFFNNRVVPATPPSLVKLYLIVSVLMTDARLRHQSDHVPELLVHHSLADGWTMMSMRMLMLSWSAQQRPRWRYHGRCDQLNRTVKPDLLCD